MTLAERVHEGYVAGRRVRVLAERIAPLVPSGARVLDVGCGDGQLAAALLERRPDLRIEGAEVRVRAGTRIPVLEFDGRTLPWPAGTFDVALFVDVLHHHLEPLGLLEEGARTARQAVIVKDHLRDGLAAAPVLRLMDRISNKRHGVPIPGNYWTEIQWRAAMAELGWPVSAWQTRLRLYPWPATWIFDRRLHFLARLDRPPAQPARERTVSAAGGPGARADLIHGEVRP